MAKTEGSACVCTKCKDGKELGRWSMWAGNGAQRSGKGDWEYEKTEEEGMAE